MTTRSKALAVGQVVAFGLVFLGDLPQVLGDQVVGHFLVIGIIGKVAPAPEPIDGPFIVPPFGIGRGDQLVGLSTSLDLGNCLISSSNTALASSCLRLHSLTW